MFKVGGKTHEPIVVTLGVNGQQLPVEVGTGAAVSVISTTTRENLFHSCQLNSTSTILTTYTGQLSSQRTQINYPHNVHRRPNACGRRDESRGELWRAECKNVSVCGRRSRSKPNGERLG